MNPATVPATHEDILRALKAVQDPELMLSLYDLGLIYKVEQQENGDVYILMTLTSPTCPMAGECYPEMEKELDQWCGQKDALAAAIEPILK